MKKIQFSLQLLAFSLCFSARAFTFAYVDTNTVHTVGTNVIKGDLPAVAFSKIQGNFDEVAAGALAPPDLITLSNGVVGLINSRLYVSALQTNVVLSSSQITLYTTNTFVFSGSNYVGRFAQFYGWTMTTPPKLLSGCDGPCPTTNQYEAVWCSYSGSNGWFQATNGFVTFTNVSVAIVGEAGGYGTLTLFGLDHPELYGRTNSFDGQNWLVNGSPIASQAYVGNYVHVLSPPVQCAGNWLFDSQSPSTTNQTVSFGAFGNTVFQLLSSYTGVHIDNFYLICTATNPFFTVDGYGATNWFTNYVFGLAGLDVAQTNLPVGWVVEECTNLTPPIVWAVDTNFTTITNSGELTIRVLHDYTIPCAFFRVRNPVTFSATITAPLTVNGSVTASNLSGSLPVTNLVGVLPSTNLPPTLNTLSTLNAAGLTNANLLTLFPSGPATVLGSNVVVSLSNASPATLSLFCITQANGSLTYSISNAAATSSGGAFSGGTVTNLQIGQWLLVSNTTDNSLMQTNPTTGVAGTISLTNGIVIVGGRAFNPGVPTLGATNSVLIASASLDANAQNNSMTLTATLTAGTQVGGSNYFVVTFSQPFPSNAAPHFTIGWSPGTTETTPSTPFACSNTLNKLFVYTMTQAVLASKVYQLNITGF